jgi:hypothetical protein
MSTCIHEYERYVLLRSGMLDWWSKTLAADSTLAITISGSVGDFMV